MKAIFAILTAILFSDACNKPENPDKYSFIVTITEPGKSQEFTIPLRCEGWCVRGATILENTTNDSIRIWDKYFEPGQTGKVFSMEGYDLYTNSAWTTRYIPYKATKGKIVIKWFVRPD